MGYRLSYKVNLHILEACNYRCKHCFAHFDSQRLLSVPEWKRIISNCVESGLASEFNIAGGEPLLYKGLSEIISYINLLGIPCSIITNGSLLTDQWIKANASKLSCIGLSIDSLNPEIQKQMGRCDGKGTILSEQKILHYINLIKACNPSCTIKVNTVVNVLNISDNLSDFISTAPVDKWKILKMSVFENKYFSNVCLNITAEAYNSYVRKALTNMGYTSGIYGSVDNIKINNKQIVIENTLKATYVMIDSKGYLVDNTGDSYRPISNVLIEPFKLGFSRLKFNKELYFSRY